MSFESDLTTLIDGYRNKINKHEVSRTLTGAADIVEKDEGWIYDETNIEPDEEEIPTLTALAPNTAVVGDAALTVTATAIPSRQTASLSSAAPTAPPPSSATPS